LKSYGAVKKELGKTNLTELGSAFFNDHPIGLDEVLNQVQDDRLRFDGFSGDGFRF
jgi:hypothetical protein